MNGSARIEELVLVCGCRSARIACDAELIPSPGRYVLAHEPASAALLASPLFLGGGSPGGFIAAPTIPGMWRPGSELNLRGPLGHGFTLPTAARRVALVCIDVNPARLLPLAGLALAQNAAVTLVCDAPPEQLPLQLEIQPERALREVLSWCDYAACDVERESLGDLLGRVGKLGSAAFRPASEVLVRAPMPCGAMADCGVCSIRTPGGDKLACLDGPVFDFRLLLGSS